MFKLDDSTNSNLCEYTDTSFKNDYMNLPYYIRVYNASTMVLRSIYLYSCLIPRIFSFSKFIIDPKKYDNQIHEWKAETKGLYVIVHGLLGTPKLSALSIANYLNDNYKNEYDIIVPIVPYKGNCTLENASNPILKIILDFIEKNPSKPVHLIGSSNGGRIVSYLEIKLRVLKPFAKVRITGIGGVYYGSNSLHYLKSIGIANCILHEDIINSLTTGSDNAISLINSMQLNNSVKRSYEFYATANDWYIPNFDSCYPMITGTHDIKYHKPFTGIDHVLLGHYLAKDIIENSVIWMNDNQ